jgi:hypothetical protein
MSLREWVDNEMHKEYGKTTVRNSKSKHLNTALMATNKKKRATLDSIAQARAKLY